MLQVKQTQVNHSAIVKSFSQKEQSMMGLASQASAPLKERSEAIKAAASGSHSTGTALNYTSLRRKDPGLILEQQNLTDGNIKARVKRVIMTGNVEYVGGAASGLNTTKIQKFIEKQKKRNAAKTKLQATIEHEKILRVHENLVKLHNFTLNNRIRQSGEKTTFSKPQPASTTHAKRSAEKSGFDGVQPKRR